MRDTITLSCFAKVNYTLDVLSRRPDGYHSLASVMQTVSLCDELRLERAGTPGIVLECGAPGVPTDETNLAWRAVDVALRAAGRREGVRILLRKRIPAQAGLGGGSSDAAAALAGVDALLDLQLGAERLRSLAAGLGSDVPYFLVGGTAAVRGRGEAVTALPDGPPLWFVIARQGVGVPTAWAYRALDERPGRISARATRHMEALVRDGDAARITARMTNDFEQVVMEEHPAVAALLDDIVMARARNARLCGSGSAVFGVALTESEAEEVARVVRLRYLDVWVCRAVAASEARQRARLAD
ncbi:MAG: 4-(cytidine 5'-diphospho)-2-C-methyl-D-erythritol kinase [Chthonomonadales bacterium]|nr:4-(cytidine 5'-diphospho)-2-C-methyl-D-erythritol kinase [Chthonomonadales bacterium]